jgi:SAM-dependent methyltransferase
MLYKESLWIKSVVNLIGSELKNSNIINLGSSTSEFIATKQPYIQTNVINVLNSIGKVVSVDIKKENGVDLVANFLTKEGQEIIKSKLPKLVVASNLLEHLPDPFIGLQEIAGLLDSGGFLLLTGPTWYPYHPDPIDNNFRPSTRSIKRLLDGKFKVTKIDSVFGGSVLTCTSANKSLAYKWFFSQIKWSVIRHNPRSFGAMIRNSLYPVRAYCALLQKI